MQPSPLYKEARFELDEDDYKKLHLDLGTAEIN